MRQPPSATLFALSLLTLAACGSPTAETAPAAEPVEPLVAAEALQPLEPVAAVEPVRDELGADVDPALAQAMFDRLKTLEGRWVHTAEEGEESLGTGAVVTYRVTSGGSAVLETEFEGSDHEMLTIYTLDRGRLTLTHYCAMNNQPRMVATAIPDADHVSFQAVGLGNADSMDTPHMHWAEIEFGADETVHTRWTIRTPDGKPGFAGIFHLRRAAE